MTQVRYIATGGLPAGVPAALVYTGLGVTILVDRDLTAGELCPVLSQLITQHAAENWTPRPIWRSA